MWSRHEKSVRPLLPQGVFNNTRPPNTFKSFWKRLKTPVCFNAADTCLIALIRSLYADETVGSAANADAYRLFWYHVLTCVSVRLRAAARSMRSCTLRYFCRSKLLSSWLSWWSVKAVRALRGFFVRTGGLSLLLEISRSPSSLVPKHKAEELDYRGSNFRPKKTLIQRVLFHLFNTEPIKHQITVTNSLHASWKLSLTSILQILTQSEEHV